jgi:hypothetical protein
MTTVVKEFANRPPPLAFDVLHPTTPYPVARWAASCAQSGHGPQGHRQGISPVGTVGQRTGDAHVVAGCHADASSG